MAATHHRRSFRCHPCYGSAAAAAAIATAAAAAASPGILCTSVSQRQQGPSTCQRSKVRAPVVVPARCVMGRKVAGATRVRAHACGIAHVIVLLHWSGCAVVVDGGCGGVEHEHDDVRRRKATGWWRRCSSAIRRPVPPERLQQAGSSRRGRAAGVMCSSNRWHLAPTLQPSAGGSPRTKVKHPDCYRLRSPSTFMGAYRGMMTALLIIPGPPYPLRRDLRRQSS